MWLRPEEGLQTARGQAGAGTAPEEAVDRGPEEIAATEPEVRAAQPKVGKPSGGAPVQADPEKIKQKRQGYLAIARNQMLTIVNPEASGKNKRAANQELLEKAFDLEPKEAARIAALPPSRQLAELKKLKVIEGNADQSQSAWNQMITARMMPEGVDPKSPEGKALAQQAKQFAQDTWNYFRLTQPSPEAAKAAVQGQWTQYVAQARTYYANAGLPYDQDAVKRVLSLAGDTQAFEHAGATGTAPVGAGFVPPTDIVGARGLDPEFARRLANVQADMAKEGIEVRLKEGGRSGYRTHEDQVAMRGGKRGKWAAQGVSTHEVAHSYDLELYVKGVRVQAGAREWETLGRVATANGLYWGKNFTVPGPEEWHVQLYPPGEDPDVNAANAAAAKAKASKKAGRKGGAPAPKRRGEAEPTTSLAQSVAPPSVGPPGPRWGVTLASAPSRGAPGAGGATQPAGKPTAGKPAARPAGKQAKGGGKKQEGIDPSKAVAALPEDPKLLATFLDECEKTGVDAAFALSVGWWETRGKWTQEETSGPGAHGVMALMPKTASDYGATDPDDPYQNVKAGVDYIKDLFRRPKLSKEKLGDKQNDYIVAAYNWGEGRLGTLGFGAAPKETRDFIVAVRTLMPQFRVLLAESAKAKQAGAGAGGKK